MRILRLGPTIILAFLAAGNLLSGCGEKIAIPEPTGLYGGSEYSLLETYQESNTVLQLGIANNTLLVLTPDSLIRRDQNFGLIGAVGGLADPTSLCVDGQQDLVFLFERGTGTVSWYASNSLELLGTTAVPAVQNVNAMVTSPRGIEQVAGARTFLYLSDPDSLVVHRYAFDELYGLTPHGILCRANGNAARFVHQPAGLARDFEGALLVADADTSRNWVIRFDSTPDLTDVTPDPEDQDPLRGLAIVFPVNSGIQPSPAADYVLGNAPGAGETEWVGAPSSEPGEFHAPTGLAVDGSGRIFVADTENHRIQAFAGTSVRELLFGNPDVTPAPTCLGVVDVRVSSSTTNFAGYIYVALRGSDEVLHMISKAQRRSDNLPPDPGLP